ncbi:hypothetical protein GCM10010282_37930 [Streptomyces roseolus]|nr:hypothetical protein GCM10010282_37930 [Streptomyces roseolus]
MHGGTGDFWVTKEATGRYSIVFQHPFPSAPSATAVIWGDGWYTTDNAQAAVLEAGRAVIVTGNSTGALSDRGFSFQIIG